MWCGLAFSCPAGLQGVLCVVGSAFVFLPALYSWIRIPSILVAFPAFVHDFVYDSSHDQRRLQLVAWRWCRGLPFSSLFVFGCALASMSCKWLLGLTIWRSASLSGPAACCSVVNSGHSVVRVIAAGTPAFVREFQGVLRALLVYGAVKAAAGTIQIHTAAI